MSLAEVLRNADKSREISRLDSRLAAQARRAVGGGIGMGSAIAANPAAATSMSFGRYTQSQTHHADQYQYYCGYPYAIIHNIANRLAAQPIRVGRILGRGKRPERAFRIKSPELLPKNIQDIAHQIEMVPDHPIHKAFNSPNPMMVRHHLLYMTYASVEITGRGYWWMFLDPDTNQFQIWPVPTHWIEPYHAKDKLFAYYRVTLPGAGVPIKVPTRQIVPFLHPDPSDPFAALAPLQANARSVMTDFAIEMAQRMSFENGINPGLAIMVGKPPEFAGVNQEQMVLTKAQRDQIIGAVRRQYRGVTRFEEPLILDALIKDVKPITTNPKEMAYKESSILARNRLSQGWGMNPITLGEIEGVNYASSGVADHHVCRNVFLPRTEANSQTMTRYMPPYLAEDEEGLIIYQEPVLPSDPELELTRDLAYFDRGALNRNDLRQKIGKPPLETGGDFSFIQGPADNGGGWIPTGGDPEENPADPDNSGVPEEIAFDEGSDEAGNDHGDEPDEEEERKPAGLKCLKRPEHPKANSKAATKKPGRPWLFGQNGEINWHSMDELDWRLQFKNEAELNRYVKATADTLDDLQRGAEKNWATQLLPVFAKLGNHAAARLREHVGKNGHVSPTEASLAVISRHRWEAELTKELEQVLFEAALCGAAAEWKAYKDATKKAGIGLPKAVIDYAKQVVQDVLGRGLVPAIVDNTIKLVRGAIKRAIGDNVKGPELADRVASEVLTGTGAEKAAIRVGRNEATHTVNQGQAVVRQALANAGKVAFSEWVSHHDNVVRNSHRALDGKRVLPGRAFKMQDATGTYDCFYPGQASLPAALRCNCRCKLITVYAVPKVGP